MEREMIRVNTRIPFDLNDWLDAEATRTGLSKSAIVMMATENYRREKEAFKSMADMGQVVEKLQQIEQMIQRNGLEG
ncbi:hypothetical protein [Sporosarcina sp. P17b]|uniref:hypothetical protein n=1 Tax=Sporosarcina sp. P17b TaxID=2048260 RepID=UPI000C1699E8|nr:hypothetical protein [Sporosarcina sp. P17b]PIC71005.1 hypothetical protein CSV76_16820 [Sporosarcina sp. P17b]